RNAEQREAVILWLARYIIADGEHAKWVATPWLGIRKATLNFAAKVSPTKADNQLTWDKVVMVAALVAGVEIDFARMLLAEIHERAFKTSTTYPFPCLIFQLCRDSRVPIWHYDRLIHPTKALDIVLIRDEANVAAPRREPQVEIPHLGADLADTAANMAPSSSRSTSVRGCDCPVGQNTEIGGSDGHTAASHPALAAKVDSRVRGQNRVKDGGHDGPEVLERSTSTIDLSSLQSELASLRVDVDAILATPIVEPLPHAPLVMTCDRCLIQWDRRGGA
ncbi:hypothetical protein H5410_061405, partial [Solanum commersonii]